MNTPSPQPSDVHEPQIRLPEITRPVSVLITSSDRPSTVDSPYTNARSLSGHLIPYSPTPARRYSRDYIPWMTGSQTSIHDEPSSINHDAPQVVAESLLQSSSSTTVHTHHGNHTPSSDIGTHLSHPLSPLHPTSDFAAEKSSGNPGARLSPQPAHIHIDTNNLEHHQSTPYSIKSSSQLSVSQKSYNSRNSIGRASYREHRGPPARDRTPSPNPDATSFGSPFSTTLRRAEPGGSVTFETIIAPPSADDPNRPGDPTVIGPRFFPLSIGGVLRYDDHRKIR